MWNDKNEVNEVVWLLFGQFSTHALMMTVRAALLSLSMNQSIKYPDILGALLYREKNLT